MVLRALGWATAFWMGALGLAHGTGPGEHVEAMIDKELEVTLHMVGLTASKDGSLAEVRLALIPANSLEACLGKTYEGCRRIVESRRKPVANLRTLKVPLSLLDATFPSGGLSEEDTRSTLAALERTKFIQELLAERKRKLPPPPASGRIQSFEELTRAGSHNAPSKFPVDRNRKFKSRVRWTVYPNGEGIRILSLEAPGRPLPRKRPL